MISEARCNFLMNAHISSWLKGNILTASQGGIESYATVGWHVGVHLDDLIINLDEPKYDQAIKDWQNLDIDNDSQVIGWCKEYIRHVMRHIPRARHGKFLEGIRQASEEERIEL